MLKLCLIIFIINFDVYARVFFSLLPQRASLKRASKAAGPNFVLWVEIKIFYLAHCMTVPVNFDRGAVRSGIRQIGNVTIFHRWSSFMENHSWLEVIKRHFVGCFQHYTAVVSALYAVLSPLYAVVRADYTRCFRHHTGCFYHFNIRGGFAIIRSGSSIIRGAFNIIRDAFIQHYFHILSMYTISRLLKFGMWLTMLFGFCLWSAMTMICFTKVSLCTL